MHFPAVPDAWGLAAQHTDPVLTSARSRVLWTVREGGEEPSPALWRQKQGLQPQHSGNWAPPGGSAPQDGLRCCDKGRAWGRILAPGPHSSFPSILWPTRSPDKFIFSLSSSCCVSTRTLNEGHFHKTNKYQCHEIILVSFSPWLNIQK